LRGKKNLKPVGIRYLVTADGRVASCKVVRPSGAKAADNEACRTAEERLQYLPALNADGGPSETWMEREVNWRDTPA